MNWIDYRKKLGVGFDDHKKANYFSTKCLNCFKATFMHRDMELEEYTAFCDLAGIPITSDYLNEFYSHARLEECLAIMQRHAEDLSDFLSYAIAFEHSVYDVSIDMICKIMKESSIQYEVFNDNDGCFIFPKGVPELDNALVSEVFEWLHEYPTSEKAWRKALKSYADAEEEKASDIADSFRKALETFFQEFFGETRALENLKTKYGVYLKEHQVPAEISNNLEALLQQYTNFMNNYAKHRDRTNDSLLEYIMYQTGNTMRLLIALKDTDR